STLCGECRGFCRFYHVSRSVERASVLSVKFVLLLYLADWKRNEALIGSGSLDGEGYSLRRQMRQRGFGYSHLSARPTLERETACQESEGATLRLGVGKVNEYHKSVSLHSRPKRIASS